MGLKKATPQSEPPCVRLREYERDAEGLCAQLQDIDPGVRRWAARDLAEHPACASRLVARLLDETDASVRSVLFTALARIGGEPVVDLLLPLLRSEDAALRNGAIEVLAALPDAVAPRIEALLGDGDSDVRIFTVNLLGQLQHPRVPRWLEQVLRQEQQANVVGAALEVLIEVGGPEMTAALHDTRRRFADDPFIAFAAEVAQQRIEAT